MGLLKRCVRKLSSVFIGKFILATIRMNFFLKGTLSYVLEWVVEEVLGWEAEVLGFSLSSVSYILETSKDPVSLFVKYKS